MKFHEITQNSILEIISKVSFKFVSITYLSIVSVPPNIDDSLSSSDVIVREGANETLTCKATGSPQPSVKWKRDDNSKITINKTLTGQWMPLLKAFQLSPRIFSFSLLIASALSYAVTEKLRRFPAIDGSASKLSYAVLLNDESRVELVYVLLTSLL